MLESNLNARLMKAMRGLHPVRVENPACPGTPDINYSGGWIESKILNRWPADPQAVVKCDHFTPQQRVWHKRRAVAGGVSYVVIQIEQDVLVLRGNDAADLLGKVNRAKLLKLALAVYRRGINEQHLQSVLVTE